MTVKTPSTGPASLPSVVPAMLTVALSPSRISIVSLAVPIVIPGSLAVIVSSVMMTVSVPSTSAIGHDIGDIDGLSSSTREDRDRTRQVVVVGAFGSATGNRVVDDRVAGTGRCLRHGEHAVHRAGLVAVGGTADADRRAIAIENIDRVASRTNRDTRIARRDRVQRNDDRLGAFDQGVGHDVGDINSLAGGSRPRIVTVPDRVS